MNVYDELAKLADLRDRGALTDEEFESEKATLLAETSSDVPSEAEIDPHKGESPEKPSAADSYYAYLKEPAPVGKRGGGSERKKPRRVRGYLIAAFCVILVAAVVSIFMKSESHRLGVEGCSRSNDQWLCNGLDLHEIDLREADLAGADFSGANLTDANLQGTSLNGANLQDANLTGANLHDTNFSEANLSYTKGWPTPDGVFEPIVPMSLAGANLSYANLSYANLTGADLRVANFFGANLKGAKLTGRNLLGADFSGADLTGANLQGAGLGWVNLFGADLTDADLTGARANGDTQWPDGFDPVAAGVIFED